VLALVVLLIIPTLLPVFAAGAGASWYQAHGAFSIAVAVVVAEDGSGGGGGRDTGLIQGQ